MFQSFDFERTWWVWYLRFYSDSVVHFVFSFIRCLHGWSSRYIIYLAAVLLNKDTTLFFNLGILFDTTITSLKILKGQSEAVNQRTDYTMAKIKWQNRNSDLKITIQRSQIEQHEIYKNKLGVNSGTSPVGVLS